MAQSSRRGHPREGLMAGEKDSRPSATSARRQILPRNEIEALEHQRRYNKKTPGIRPDGESGRSGIHPFHFFRIIWHSSSRLSRAVNILWPFVPAAIVVHYVHSLAEQHTLRFTLAYLAMIPCANLIGFAGAAFAKKMPHVLGILVETTLGSIVEIILFIVLLVGGNIAVVQAAILGSILANMLLCLGACFIAGGIRQQDAEFDETIAEAGSGLLLTAAAGLAAPAIFQQALQGRVDTGELTQLQLDRNATHLSRAVAIFLLIAYIVYIYFQTKTHHGIITSILEEDEERDLDKHQEAMKPKLTLTECVIALTIAIGLVSLIAVKLVEDIEPLVQERNVSDAFMGLILVPLVEKVAEHLTAIDEAWDNQMNFALSHILSATLQTALFNAPLIVIVGWGMHNDHMSFTFQIFDMAMLLISVITVGNFLRDQKSNYLEGVLLIILYCAIAASTYFWPNAAHAVE